MAFGLAIFCGAFLLFLVQPLMARYILPWFGGGPAVWTTCMLFFQVLLLGGYAYAHWSVQNLSVRRQVLVHLALLGVALFFLPIAPADHWKPVDGTAPMGRILGLLGACLGVPYLVLAATGPLMQAWFSRVQPGLSPYRLYALSNLGSLLALVSYPVLVEPVFSRRTQSLGWSAGLVVFAVCCAWCGLQVWRSNAPAAPETAANPDDAADAKVPWAHRGLWLVLPACGVVLLLAVTNRICQDIAVIPFLWVLPLGLYLLTFIISFDSPRWYWRPFWLPLAAAGVFGVVWMRSQGEGLDAGWMVGISVAAMFAGCMVCHGEVCRLRPPPAHLTGFYLALSGGGAIGGLFVALVAPLIYRHYHEFQMGFASVGWLILVVLLLDRGGWSWRKKPVLAGGVLILLTVGAIAATLALRRDARKEISDSVEVTRNFYGVLKITEDQPTNSIRHTVNLFHGSITHGKQYTAPERRRWPTTYYTGTSGVGLLLTHLRAYQPRRVGVVGLGTCSLAVWGKAGDTFRFYEINPEVLRLARSRFTFLADALSKVEVVLGDARLSFEREPDQQFDILALDAFSGDAIPVHLLTREAFAIYGRHLKPDGVLAVHISNSYLNLEPILRRAAADCKLTCVLVKNPGTDDLFNDDGEDEIPEAYSSDWALLCRSSLNIPEIASVAATPAPISPKVELWTDDRSSLWPVMLFHSNSFLHRWQQR